MIRWAYRELLFARQAKGGGSPLGAAAERHATRAQRRKRRRQGRGRGQGRRGAGRAVRKVSRGAPSKRGLHGRQGSELQVCTVPFGSEASMEEVDGHIARIWWLRRQVRADERHIFKSVTTLDDESATSILEESRWNVRRAVDAFYIHKCQAQQNEADEARARGDGGDGADKDLHGGDAALDAVLSCNLDGCCAISELTRCCRHANQGSPHPPRCARRRRKGHSRACRQDALGAVPPTGARSRVEARPSEGQQFNKFVDEVAAQPPRQRLGMGERRQVASADSSFWRNSKSTSRGAARRSCSE